MYASLRALDQNLAHRRMIAETYERVLVAHDVPVSRVPSHMRPAYVRYPVWASDRDAVARAVNRYALPGLWFRSVLEDGASLAAGGYQPGSCPCAECRRPASHQPTHPSPRDSGGRPVDRIRRYRRPAGRQGCGGTTSHTGWGGRAPLGACDRLASRGPGAWGSAPGEDRAERRRTGYLPGRRQVV